METEICICPLLPSAIETIGWTTQFKVKKIPEKSRSLAALGMTN
jgi:hypothetical protein